MQYFKKVCCFENLKLFTRKDNMNRHIKIIHANTRFECVIQFTHRDNVSATPSVQRPTPSTHTVDLWGKEKFFDEAIADFENQGKKSYYLNIDSK